jgi:signal peptidase I
MDKYNNYLLIIPVSVIVIMAIIFFYYPSLLTHKQNLAESNYTTLQPSNFFVGDSKIIENHAANYLKLEIGRDFNVTQAASTGSMLPTIGDASILIVIKPKEDELKVGDIIVFYCNEDYPKIGHRIIGMENDTFLTKGDNNQQDDFQGFGCKPKYSDIRYKIVGILY